MGVKHYNLARMSTATGGTGTMTLMAAVTGFLSFASAGVQDGDYITYAIEEGNNREVGRGTYTASGSTLTRDTILASTAGIGTPITLTGNAQVYITIAAEDLGGVSVGVPSAPPAAGQSQLYSLVSATPKNVTNWGMSSATFASSSSYNSGVPPIRVFNAVVDASHSAGWLTANTTTGWIQVQLIAPAVITGYAVMGWSVDTFPGRCPRDWTLQGSNNGVDWTVLDTQTNQTTWTLWTRNTYALTGVTTAYSYYKLVVTANNGDSYLGLSQFRLLSATPIRGNPVVLCVEDQYGDSTVIGL